MLRLYTKEQVFRAIRKHLKQHLNITNCDGQRELAFELMDDKLVNHIYLDLLVDFYSAGLIEEEEFDAAYDAMYLYYGDIIEEYFKEIDCE